MCGIFGYMGPKQAAPILVEGLRRLEYRGYDSSGIALKNGDFRIYKKTGKVAELQAILPDNLHGNLGIAHTRWATHGAVTDQNAHPHLSKNGKVVIVHNGIIENARTLRTLLSKKGVVLNSETDSEVLVQLISELYYEGEGDLDFKDAVKAALQEVVGAYGIVAMCSDEPNTLVAARMGSPLVFGVGDELFNSLKKSKFMEIDPITKKLYFE